MRLVIVEDSELVRNQLIRILAVQTRIHVVGVCDAEKAAVRMILELQPDAVLLDLTLSPGSGLSVLKCIREAACASRVLVLTNNTDNAIKLACEAMGVSGFFDKCLEAEACLQQLYEWLPPLPDNELARLQLLRDVRLLDQPEEETFDAIARLARDITVTPIALVSLVDQDRQWFLSRQGLDVRETSRSIAFCAHAIKSSELMEVPDALLDGRFCDNPMVRGEPKLRFYAGVPLVMLSGEALGTLCVFDHQPRQLNERQRDGLKTLAHCVSGEIELRRKMQKLEKEIERSTSAEALMTQLAMRDSLTQLPNRAALLDRMDQQLRLAARKGSRLAFLFIDLDRFKLINDTQGHDVGDAALLEVANRLRAALRESDTVARLGGDEFAVLLPDIGPAEAAMAKAAQLNLALVEVAHLNGKRLHLGASIGVTVYPEHGSDVETLMRNADAAMYRAKQSGGGRACLASILPSDLAQDLMLLETDLRDAVERREIIAFYQPQVRLGGGDRCGGDLCGVEALARWQHPQLGILGPDKFIAFAESRGFIHELGACMLELALAQLVRWDATGLRIPLVAVNVSALELRGSYAARVAAALAKYGVAPGRLELEITESALACDQGEAVAILQSLRRGGVGVAVDDFGVGFSSLGQLRRMPIDVLKIDKCFVDEVHSNTHDAAIVSAVVTMAKSLGLRTVAEGVEDIAQLNKLQELGCDCIQGYAISRPLNPQALHSWARQPISQG